MQAYISRSALRTFLKRFSIRHYCRAILTSFYQFWAQKIRAHVYVEENFEFFVKYNWLQQSRNFHYEASKTLKMFNRK